METEIDLVNAPELRLKSPDWPERIHDSGWLDKSESLTNQPRVEKSLIRDFTVDLQFL